MSSKFYHMVSALINEHTNEKQNQEELFREKIALYLRAYRADKNLSQDGLSLKLGITRRQLIRWENRECTPSQLALSKMESIGISLPAGSLRRT